ncbi:exportin-T isoform X2 [Hydra vulgaris]|uniref:Exportin-T n=1 Tax=Hydra vulgaris TaxID=6087 RepID=A0ABM4DFF5_HYDVU
MDNRLLHLLTSSDSSEVQQHILKYFEEFKKQDQGWQLCANVLESNIYRDERVQFFCLQVLEAHIKSRYAQIEDSMKENLKSCLRKWYFQCCITQQKNFILNKTSHLLCLVFIQEYPNKWTSFFTELLELLEKGPLAVDLYLRVLLAVDEEVVARHIPHTPQELERNTTIKDYMRDHCINDLVESWYQILQLYEQADTNIVCLCLKVMGAFVSWININLIANDRFISHLLGYLSNEKLRGSTCSCLLEIINKGMEPAPKTQLVKSLAKVLENTGVLSANIEDETDFTVKLSSLINGMGVQLISSFNKLSKIESESGLKIEILDAIDTNVLPMLRFLGDDDDDVSEAVFEFCHGYLNLLKQLNGTSICANKHIKDIILVVIKKLKFDEDFDFENEGDDEVDFLEYRKQMKVLFNYLAKLDGKLFISSIYEITNCTFKNWRQLPFKDVEVAVYILYCLGEAFPAQELFTDALYFSLFQNMMCLLIDSNINEHKHSAIKLQFFETVTRYERFFYAQTQYIPTVLIAFLDEHGLKNLDCAVSSRASFLLMRFIKSLKNQMQPYVEDVFRRVQEILGVKNEKNVGISENDKYYLYEVAAILVTCSNASQEKQLIMMESLTSPVVLLFQQYIEQISCGLIKDDEEIQEKALALHHMIAYLSRASKAFGTAQSMKQSGCTPCFTKALSIFLHSLSMRVHRDLIHDACRQYLHRMIICLGDQVLPFIPIAVNSLLKDCEMRDIQEFIPLINQLITRFKSNIAPFLSEICMPLVSQIFAFIRVAIEPNDLQAIKEKQLLQRSYFLFISAIVNSNILEVITNQESSNVKEILLSIVHGAVEIPDPQSQKTCFIILCKLVESWGNEDTIKEFLYDSILPACFMAPLNSAFDLEDAQTAFVLQEISNTQKMCLQKRGVEVIQWLEQIFLPRNNCPPVVIQEYSQALQNMNAKAFKNYLSAFYSRWKT